MIILPVIHMLLSQAIVDKAKKTLVKTDIKQILTLFSFIRKSLALEKRHQQKKSSHSRHVRNRPRCRNHIAIETSLAFPSIDDSHGPSLCYHKVSAPLVPPTHLIYFSVLSSGRISPRQILPVPRRVPYTS